jgi:Arc/MetJ family transcription regulator
MKRTNLVLDEDLLKTATRLLGAKTYSAAVNQALAEAIRSSKARALGEFIGTGVWQGSLAEMREDKPKKKRK